MSDITKTQREFIGSAFKTRRGGVLTVTEVHGKDSRGIALFTLTCSICSKDEELWPDGSIFTTKANLLSGVSPCGCTKTPSWSETQWKVRVKRKCEEMGYEFLNWDLSQSNGEFSGNTTYLCLYNPVTNNRWCSTRIANLMNGIGDPLAIKIKTPLKSDEEHIADFYKAGFTSDYRFWRSDRESKAGDKPYWYYTCPVCSNDEYVQNGLCSGVFEMVSSYLKKGRMSCRCKSYIYTQGQVEFSINKLCKEGGHTFLGWDGTYNTKKSKFHWICNRGHKCLTSVDKFGAGRRCGTCASGGFSKDKSASLYLVRWYGFGESYLKFGVTNRLVEERVKEQASTSKLDYEILACYKNNGVFISCCEKALKTHFSQYQKCPESWLPSGWTETVIEDEESLYTITEYIKLLP